MITVVFKGEDIYARESGLWQYDFGQKLRIEGLDISEVTEIDFSLKTTGGEAIPVVAMPRGGGIEVGIPDSLLAAKELQNYFIYAFIYLIDGESGETTRRITLDVKARPGRTGEDLGSDPDPFAEAINEVRDAAARAENAAVTATEAIVEVEVKGTEQIGIIAAEGAKQLDEIARVMATIPEDYAVLSELADSNYRNKAPVIIENASGSLIELKDASDLPMQGLTVYGKSTQRTTTGAQMIDVKNLRAINAVLNYSPDGKTITLEGSKAYCSAEYKIPTNIVEQLCGKNIYIKYKASIDSGSNIHIRIDKNDGTETYVRGESILIPEDTKNIIVRVMCNDSSVDLQNPKKVTFTDAMISLSPIAEWEPYTGGMPAPNPNYPQEIESVGEEVEVKVTGMNLYTSELDYASFDTLGLKGSLINSVFTVDGIRNEDAPNSRPSVTKNCKIFSFVGKTMYIKAENPKFISDFMITDINDNRTYVPKYTVTGKEKKIEFRIIYNGESSNAPPAPGTEIHDSTRFMISYEPIDAFEQPKLSYSILPTPNGLPGIPVTSGGNYIDPDGQQWVCDTIEWDRESGTGEYVQRIVKDIVDSVDSKDSGSYPLWFLKNVEAYHFYKHDWSLRASNAMCDMAKVTGYAEQSTEETRVALKTTGSSSGWAYCIYIPDIEQTVDAYNTYLAEHPFSIISQAGKPIRTPLTADQIKALESLHTFSPTSIISNDAGSDMEVIYAADTKAYIDSKIDALSKTILDAIAGGN